MFKNRLTIAIFLIISTLVVVGTLWMLRTSKVKAPFEFSETAYRAPHEGSSFTEEYSSEKKGEIAALLQQPFTYLDRGKNVFAFVSRDQEYVLKLFKNKPLHDPWYLSLIPNISYFREFLLQKRQKSLGRVLESYQVAYTNDPEGCALVYLHFHPHQHLGQSVTLIDELGEARRIPLDGMSFVLQEKATEFRQVLQQLLDEDQVVLARERVHALLSLYKSHHEMGMYDCGIGFVHNNGFIGERPVHFDVSKMVAEEMMKSPEAQQKDLRRCIGKVSIWMDKHYPQHRDAIVTGMLEELSRSDGRPSE